MRASVIVTTYRQPRELGLALAAISRQSCPPDEVVVADDGSGPETAEVVERWRPRIGCGLEHVWHPDEGWRKPHIVNRAVRRSRGEHLIFLDGDTFPHRHWVADHLAAANERRVLIGRRVKLGPRISPTITEQEVLSGAFDHPLRRLAGTALCRDVKRLNLGLRLPAGLARLVHRRWKQLLGVNYSLPRAAYYAVNGLHEAHTVYGSEDIDLGWRLHRAGYENYALLNRAVVFHLWHVERERGEEAQRLQDAIYASDVVRAEPGLDRVPDDEFESARS